MRLHIEVPGPASLQTLRTALENLRAASRSSGLSYEAGALLAQLPESLTEATAAKIDMEREGCLEEVATALVAQADTIRGLGREVSTLHEAVADLRLQLSTARERIARLEAPAESRDLTETECATCGGCGYILPDSSLGISASDPSARDCSACVGR